jgi:hypothetical protein
MPEEYSRNMLKIESELYPASPKDDPRCLATLKHYRSLIPMAQEVRKPIFHLTSADGAIGSHARAVADAHDDFRKLAAITLERAGINLEDTSLNADLFA